MVEKWDPVLGPPGPLGPLGPPGPPRPWDPQYLRITLTPKTPRTSGPSNPLRPQDLRTFGKLPLPFEIQNLNTVQLFLICCKNYCDEVSHRYDSVVFLANV